MRARTLQPNRARRGVATIEMALLTPLYMIIILTLIFVAYLTLDQARERQAAAYAAWTSGAQSSEEVAERFFPWVRLDEGGFDGGAGDDETEIEVVSDDVQRRSGYPVEGVEDIMARMSLGEYYQNFSFTAGGGVQGSVGANQTEFGAYLTGMGFSNMDGRPMTPRPANVSRAADAFNGTGSERWMTEREAKLAVRYRPWFLRWVYEDEDENYTAETYLLGSPEDLELGAEPKLEETFSVIGRGSLTRRGARESSPDQVYREVCELAGNPALTDPMDPVEMDLIATGMGGSSIYVSW